MSVLFGGDTKLMVTAHKNTKIMSMDLIMDPRYNEISKHLKEASKEN